MKLKAFVLVTSLCALSFIIPYGCGQKKFVQVPIVGGQVDDGATDPIVIPPPPPIPDPAFVTFDAEEDAILRDLSDRTNVERRFIKYAKCSDQFDEGLPVEDVDKCRKSIQKGLNSLSNERAVVLAKPVDGNRTIYSFDIRDLGWTLEKWCLVQAADPFKFESKTFRGDEIKRATQDPRPWIHANNLMRVAHNGETYYALMNVPLHLADFLNQQGVNLQRQFDEVTDTDGLVIAGFQGSPIALGKNRLIQRVETTEGFGWATYDFNTTFNDFKDLFKFPFPVEARSQRTFKHDAQEYIFPLKNGLSLYALFNGAGLRADFAPTDTVVDTEAKGLDPTIRNSQKCMKCHANGKLLAVDQLLKSVLANPNIGGDDKVRAQKLFKSVQVLADAFAKDNAEYQAALAKMGIGPRDEDPINKLVDKLDKEMTAKQVAAIFNMKEAEFIEKLKGSGIASDQVGGLLSPGGTIQPVQFPAASKVIVEQLGIFTDDPI